MSKKDEELDVLSSYQNTGDLWAELQKSCNTDNAILNLVPNRKYYFRFLGPFVAVKRAYINSLKPIMKYLTVKEIESLLDKNEEVIKKATELAKNIDPNNNTNNVTESSPQSNLPVGVGVYGWNYITTSSLSPKTGTGNDTLKFIQELSIKKNWQRCVMTNAYIKVKGENYLGIVPLNRSLIQSLVSVRGNTEDTRISGINACDVIIEKRGSGLQTKFHVEIASPSFLTYEETSNVLNKGLIDIVSAVKRNNNKKTSVFFYKAIEDYRMPDELMQCLIEDAKIVEENRHLQQADDNFEEIPLEAFENRPIIDNGIMGLEI